jgi:hypothetical protein
MPAPGMGPATGPWEPSLAVHAGDVSWVEEGERVCEDTSRDKEGDRFLEFSVGNEDDGLLEISNIELRGGLHLPDDWTPVWVEIDHTGVIHLTVDKKPIHHIGDVTVVSNDPETPRFSFQIEVPCPWHPDPSNTPPQ